MSTKAFSLDAIRIASSNEDLKLGLKTTARLHVEHLGQFPTELSLPDFQLGKIWVPCARTLYLDVEVLLDGTPLLESSDLQILEKIGSRLCNVKMWETLGLSATFNAITETSRLRVKVGKSTPVFVPPDARPRHAMRHNEGLMVPRDVLRAKLESLSLKFIFTSAGSTKIPPSKRIRSGAPKSELPDIMLFDPGDQITRTAHSRDFENVVNSLQSLPQSMASYFDLGISFLSGPTAWAVILGLTSANIEAEELGKSPHFDIEQMIQNICETKEKMLFISDDSMPHPDLLSSHYSLEINDSAIDEEEMIFIKETPGIGVADDLEMLFDNDVEMLDQASSAKTTSSISTKVSSDITSNAFILKRTSLSGRGTNTCNQTSLLRENISTCDLIEKAFLILVSGRLDGRLLNGAVIHWPYPTTALGIIAPSLFQRGFADSMTVNSQFIFPISQTLSTTILFRAQSPSLREKLERLANINVPPPPTPSTPPPNDERECATSSKVFPTLQSRIWTMMHRTLYDATTTKKLWHARSAATNLPSGRDDFIDLLRDGSKVDEAQFSEREFDDLLDVEEDNDFFDCLDEADRERLAIERETEEMLLGESWRGTCRADKDLPGDSETEDNLLDELLY